MDADAGPAVSRHMHDDEEERHDEVSNRPPDGSFPDRSFVEEVRAIYRQHFHALQESEAQRPRRRPAPRLPLRMRPALVAALTLLFAGAAVAAVTLSLKHSAPLSGRLPPQASAARWGFGFSEAGRRYRIVFAPILAAGDAGWTSVLYLGRREQEGGASSGSYPTTAMPLVRSTGAYMTTGQQGGEVIRYVLTGPSVAYVQVGSQTIQTRGSRALPAGDRVAVFTDSPHRRLRPTPRQRSQHFKRGLARPLPVRPLHAVPLDSSGNPISHAGSSEHASRLPIRAWHHAPGSAAEAAGACSLSRAGLPALTPVQAEVALILRPVRNAVGELLLSCLQTTFTLHGSQLRAAILLNARHPGLRPPGPIPGARPVKGHPSTVNAVLGPTVGDITARRSGNAWLTVAGGSGLAQRLEVLEALRIAKIAAQKPHGS